MGLIFEGHRRTVNRPEHERESHRWMSLNARVEHLTASTRRRCLLEGEQHSQCYVVANSCKQRRRTRF
jgi:hypothetical protein